MTSWNHSFGAPPWLTKSEHLTSVVQKKGRENSAVWTRGPHVTVPVAQLPA